MSSKRIYRRAVFANILAATTLCLPVVVLGNLFLKLWMGTKFAGQSQNVVATLAVAFGLLSINVVPHYTLLGVGKVRFVSLMNLAGGAASLLAAAVLIPFFGLVGAAAGRILYGPLIALNYAKVARTL